MYRVKTITLVAWRRPAYTRRALEALSRCRGLTEYSLLVSVDGPCDELSLATARVAREFSPRVLVTSERNLGVAGNPPATYELALSMGSTFNVAIEDDCELSPDALEMADWFHDHPQRDKYVLMSLGCKSTGNEPPESVMESDQIECPWAWCFTADTWGWIKPRWNSKKYHPTGHDWSLSFEMALCGQRSLYPKLSRAFNFGQYGGVHTVPETYQEELGNCVASEGSYRGPYEITCELPFGHSAYKPWMQEELNARGLAVTA